MSTDNLHDVDGILDRVKQAENLSSDAKLADFLGVKAGTISAWRSRGSINLDLVLAKCREYNSNWILYAELPMRIVDLNQVSEPGLSYETFEEKVDNFVVRAIAQIEASDVDVEEKKRIARSLLRIAREELAKIEAEERSKGQDDQA